MSNFDNYIKEEEKLFYTQKKGPCYPISFRRKILMGILLAVSIVTLHSNEKIGTPKGLFSGDTWTCRKCGYSSYVGINRCPVCGKEKHTNRQGQG